MLLGSSTELRSSCSKGSHRSEVRAGGCGRVRVLLGGWRAGPLAAPQPHVLPAGAARLLLRGNPPSGPSVPRADRVGQSAGGSRLGAAGLPSAVSPVTAAPGSLLLQPAEGRLGGTGGARGQERQRLQEVAQQPRHCGQNPASKSGS